jgi:flagellar FliJ protein
MSSRPRLATLLTLRRAEHDIAAAELATATQRRRDAAALAARTRASLDHLAPAAADLHQLRALAAARLSSANMLAELRDVTAAAQGELEKASAAYTSASVRLRAIEKLRDRAATAAREEELAREQAALDEIGLWRRAVPA